MSKDPIRMIDISEKEIVPRRATAEGRLVLKESTVKVIKDGKVKKGAPLPVAEIASIQAVKKTPDLIPLCHPIPIGQVDTTFTLGNDYIDAKCTVTAHYKTGVEMEALTGVTVALLNIWDMVKYLEKDKDGQYPEARITDIRVTEKRKG
ncbi:MAG: cyclic pyranopterin monophosphate synthase MoaC [Candidatus Bathyarchaeota archaeon]|nr:cyclic pyranopterin monophosphate synthase MoaC [Candidatus Bathyarchaeota archaeon]